MGINIVIVVNVGFACDCLDRFDRWLFLFLFLLLLPLLILHFIYCLFSFNLYSFSCDFITIVVVVVRCGVAGCVTFKWIKCALPKMWRYKTTSERLFASSVIVVIANVVVLVLVASSALACPAAVFRRCLLRFLLEVLFVCCRCWRWL